MYLEPFLQVNILNLEQVQRKFLRYVAYKLKCNLNYSAIEHELNIKIHETRCFHKAIKLLYNIINSNIPYSSLLEKVGLHVPLKSTQSAKTSQKTAHRTNYGYNSCICRVSSFTNLNIDKLEFFTGLFHFLKELQNCTPNKS